jgi:hypothetical protein
MLSVRTQKTLRSAGLVLLALAPFMIYIFVAGYLNSASSGNTDFVTSLVYPNARNPDTIVKEDQWLGQVKSLSFLTSDSPDLVAGWYTGEMEKRGWWKDPSSTTNRLTFLYFETCGSHPCRVEVEITPAQAGQTQVDLKVY